MPSHDVNSLISSLANSYQVTFYNVLSSLSTTGIDLGSFDFHNIAPTKPLILTGDGTSASEVGELWYFMDNHVGVALTQVDSARLPSLTLEGYSHLFIADGNYRNLDDKYTRKLGQFVNDGGIIIAQKGALEWLSRGNLLKNDLRSPRYFSQLFPTEGLSFADKSKLNARQAIGGAVVALDIDPTHPVTFGIESRVDRRNLPCSPSQNGT